MDPNVTLQQIRELALFLRQNPLPTAPGHTVDVLVELVQALDRWITRGGFLPNDWVYDKHAHMVKLEEVVEAIRRSWIVKEHGSYCGLTIRRDEKICRCGRDSVMLALIDLDTYQAAGDPNET